MPTEYELGLLVGLLIGEGHFGGDGKQPQITLRMHVRHEALFRWLEATFPGGKLYGPYDHSGRRYYQWMARGSFLRDELIPLIESRVVSDLDGYTFSSDLQRCRVATHLSWLPGMAPGRLYRKSHARIHQSHQKARLAQLTPPPRRSSLTKSNRLTGPINRIGRRSLEQSPFSPACAETASPESGGA